MRKSILGNIYFFTSKVILYSLKRQQIIVQFTTEAEYYALAKVISKALWLKQIIG